MVDFTNLFNKKADLVEAINRFIDKEDVDRKTHLIMKQIKVICAHEYYYNLQQGKSADESLHLMISKLENLMISYKGTSQTNIKESIKGMAETLKDIPRAQAMGENRGKNL